MERGARPGEMRELGAREKGSQASSRAQEGKWMKIIFEYKTIFIFAFIQLPLIPHVVFFHDAKLRNSLLIFLSLFAKNKFSSLYFNSSQLASC